MSLFRKEAVEQQSERLHGCITLTQPMSLTLSIGILLISISFILIFIATAQYSRKETVRGFIQPNSGVVKVFSKQAGIINKLWVSEGQKIEKGQPLISVINSQTNHLGADVHLELINQLQQQLTLVTQDIEQHKQIQHKQKLNLETQFHALSQELISLEQQLTLSKRQTSLLQKQKANNTQLIKQGFTSVNEQNRLEQQLLATQQEQQNISGLIIQKQNEIKQNQFTTSSLPQHSQLQINQLQRQQIDLQRQIEQIHQSSGYTIVAQQSGTVSSVLLQENMTIHANRILMHILPRQSQLVAELLLPTRSAGMIKSGQLTKFRFDAFPYQKFGFIEGQVDYVTNSLIFPNDIQLPIPIHESVYRVRASLQQQNISMSNQAFALKSGMLFEADIILDTRSILEWLIAPLYGLKNKLG